MVQPTNQEQIRMELLVSSIDNIIAQAGLLREALLNPPSDENRTEDDLSLSEGFENLHGAMKVYAEEFTAYEAQERIGYGTVSVSWERG